MKLSLITIFLFLVSTVSGLTTRTINGHVFTLVDFDGTPNDTGNCIKASGVLGSDFTTACSASEFNLGCCEGTEACFWTTVKTVTICKDSCSNGSKNCYWPSWHPGPNTLVIGEGSCRDSTSACSHLGVLVTGNPNPDPSDMTATIGSNSCRGYHACGQLSDSNGGDVVVGQDSCRGGTACVYGIQPIGVGSCLGYYSCGSAGKATAVGPVGHNSCFGLRACYEAYTVGNNVCTCNPEYPAVWPNPPTQRYDCPADQPAPTTPSTLGDYCCDPGEEFTSYLNGDSYSSIGPNGFLVDDRTCTPAVDDCAGVTCPNSGETCVDQYNSYTCEGPAPAPGPAPSANQCDNKSYCVAFKEVASTLGGTGADISLTYDASKQIDSTNSYQTTILKSDCQPFASTPTPAVSVVANSYAYSGTSTPSTMSLSLDIDTAKIEGQGELSTPTTDNKFDVSFCVKTELMYTDAAVSTTPIEVASSKTVLTLTVNKAKDFQFSITAAQEATGSKAADVTVSYPLLQCVCALGANDPTITGGVAQCLTNYGDLNPGAAFKFCVQAVDDAANPPAVLTEVEVEALKNVFFENDGDGTGATANPTLNSPITVPIVGDATAPGQGGVGVGPASVDCTTTAGLCVVSAVTFAKLYEANIDSDPELEDISNYNKVKGKAILKFKTRRHLGSGSAQEEKESIEVGFVGSSAVRQLQADDGTPVDEFAMDVSLATPPDRSAATGASLAMAYASLMVGGIVGVVML